MSQTSVKPPTKVEIINSNYCYSTSAIFLLLIATNVSATSESNESNLQPLNTETTKIAEPNRQDMQKSEKIFRSETIMPAEYNKAKSNPSRVATGKIRKSDAVQNGGNSDNAEKDRNRPVNNDTPNINSHQNDMKAINLPIAQSASSKSLLEPKADKGNPLRIGNILLKPSLRISYGHDNNVNRAPDNRVKVSSAVIRTAAGLAADIEHKGDTYRLDYQVELQKYISSSIDNIETHTLNLQGLNILNSRNSVKWNMGIMQGADPRGSTDATLNVPGPSKYRKETAKGTYVYGIEGAKGRLEFDAFASNKRYLNNRETMDKADVNSLGTAGRFFWRIMPKTSAVLDLRHTEYQYKESTALLDSTETNYFVGLNWNATAATTGSFRVGHTTRDYKDRSDFNGMSWETGITWKPLTYSIFNFSAIRSVNDTVGGASNNFGNFIVNSTYEARWNHEWRHNLNSSIGWRHTQSDYDGIDRKDTQDIISADLRYKLRPQVDIGLEMNWSNRQSNFDQFDYERRLIMGLIEFNY